MNEIYEIQIQFLENNNSMWISLVNEENKFIYIFPTEEEAKKNLDKIQIENYHKQCRIVKK